MFHFWLINMTISISQMIKILQLNQLYHIQPQSTPPQWRHLRLALPRSINCYWSTPPSGRSQQPIVVVGYHGSCRIAVDAQGELQRLFHARALTKSATLEKLLQQVRHWQQRVSVNITAKSMRNSIVSITVYCACYQTFHPPETNYISKSLRSSSDDTIRFFSHA